MDVCAVCEFNNNNNNNNNCLKSNIQCIEIRVQWTVHLGSSHMHVHAVTRVHAVTPKLVIFGSKVRPRTFGCVAMGSALLFIVRSRLLVYSAGSGVNRVQVVLSGFNKRLFCFVQAKTLCMYGCMYFLSALVLVCVDVIVMSSA